MMSASDCIEKLDNIRRPMQICFVDGIVSAELIQCAKDQT
jgi:hypothetical protein